MVEESPLTSIVIPCRNSSPSLRLCLESVEKAVNAHHGLVEAVLADDASTDGSPDIAKEFGSVRLVALPLHSGASAARNAGAKQSRGEFLFFIDSDCILTEETMTRVFRAIRENAGGITGGTYTKIPHDGDFFSRFQSLSVNHFETRGRRTGQDEYVGADYAATHAMIISRDLFLSHAGFREKGFLPIIEDVEFSHRLKKAGVRVVIDPHLQVRHVFNFNLARSLKNAWRKSHYWTMYSIRNRDLTADSGTASLGLKVNGISFLLTVLMLIIFAATKNAWLLAVPAVAQKVNALVNIRFLIALLKAGGTRLWISGALYYMTFYAGAVIAGGMTGLAAYLSRKRLKYDVFSI